MVIDEVQNTHGKQFIDFLKAAGLCTLNGRGQDNFTYISTNGSSVVDYCIVDKDSYHNFLNFSVVTMADILASSSYMEYQSISDHSLLTWNVALYNMQSNVIAHKPPGVDQKRVHYNLQNIPVSCLQGHLAKFSELAQRLHCHTITQKELDDIYLSFCQLILEEMDSVLSKQMHCGQRCNKSSPWWNLLMLAKRWLKCRQLALRAQLRDSYKRRRREYFIMIRKAKRAHAQKIQDKLCSALQDSQSSFWSMTRRIVNLNRKKNDNIPLQVIQDGHLISSLPEVLNAWHSAFNSLLMLCQHHLYLEIM